MVRYIRYITNLYPITRAHGAIWIGIVLKIAIVSRIGIDDAPDGIMLGCNLGLNASPDTTAVAGNHDFPLDIYALRLQGFVVLGSPIADVDKLTRHVPITGIGVVGRQPVGDNAGSGIFFQCGFREGSHKRNRLRHFKQAFFWSREQYLKLLD